MNAKQKAFSYTRTCVKERVKELNILLQPFSETLNFLTSDKIANKISIASKSRSQLHIGSQEILTGRGLTQ